MSTIVGSVDNAIQLSSIGFCHGERRQLAELARAVSPDKSLSTDGLVCYRTSELEIWELGAAAAELTLDRASVTPDAVLYVSENDTQTVDSLARLLDRLALPETHHLAVSGHDCGNFAPALAAAYQMIVAGSAACILLILADRAPQQRRRLMSSGLSVFSDGAAACLVTGSTSQLDTRPRFRIDAIAMRSRVRTDVDSDDAALLSTVERVGGSVTDLLRHLKRDRQSYRYVLFPNYRVTSQRFLTTAMGFPDESLLLGSVADYAHCFSADVLATLCERHADRTLSPGNRLLASSTGPQSWSTIALEAL